MNRITRTVALASCALALGSINEAILAQPAADHIAPIPEGAPELAEPIRMAISAPYLTEEERADKRVFHGLWYERDLDDPARRARAASPSPTALPTRVAAAAPMPSGTM